MQIPVEGALVLLLLLLVPHIFILLFETESNYVAKASLEFITNLRVALNSQCASVSGWWLILRARATGAVSYCLAFCPVIIL